MLRSAGAHERQERSTSEEAPINYHADLAHMRCLRVDDTAFLETAQTLLAGEGVTVTGAASNGAEELIRVQATAARIVCGQMTALALQALRDSVERASCLPSRPGWERKAAAHAEIFHLLANAAGSPAATDPFGSQVRVIRDMMRTVGPAANGMVTGSRRRLLAFLGAGDADGAAQEIESHLRVLRFMARLARYPARQTAGGHSAVDGMRR